MADEAQRFDDAWYERKGRETFDAWLLAELLTQAAQQQPDPKAYKLDLRARIEQSRNNHYEKPFPAELESFNRRMEQVFKSAEKE